MITLKYAKFSSFLMLLAWGCGSEVPTQSGALISPDGGISSSSGAGGSSPCPDGDPCGHPGVDQWGTCLGGFCCTSCVADGVCAISKTSKPPVCGEHGAACDPDGTACGNGWTCEGGHCGACAAPDTKCVSHGGGAGWCAIDKSGELACLSCYDPELAGPSCPAGCAPASRSGMCQGGQGEAGCPFDCCPICYAVSL